MCVCVCYLSSVFLYSCLKYRKIILHTTLPCSGHFHRDHPANMFDFYVFMILENMMAL